MPVKDKRKCIILKQSKINQIFVFCQGKVETNYLLGLFLDFSSKKKIIILVNSIFVFAKPAAASEAKAEP